MRDKFLREFIFGVANFAAFCVFIFMDVKILIISRRQISKVAKYIIVVQYVNGGKKTTNFCKTAEGVQNQ